MAIAPSGFGSFGGDLLVGNFGNATATSPDGTIVAINLTTGALAGTIDGANGSPIANAGQWSLLFGNGGSGGTAGTLYISAGIDCPDRGPVRLDHAGGVAVGHRRRRPADRHGYDDPRHRGPRHSRRLPPASWWRRSSTPVLPAHRRPTPRRSTGATARHPPARSRPRARQTGRTTTSSAIIPTMVTGPTRSRSRSPIRPTGPWRSPRARPSSRRC